MRGTGESRELRRDVRRSLAALLVVVLTMTAATAAGGEAIIPETIPDGAYSGDVIVAGAFQFGAVDDEGTGDILKVTPDLDGMGSLSVGDSASFPNYHCSEDCDVVRDLGFYVDGKAHLEARFSADGSELGVKLSQDYLIRVDFEEGENALGPSGYAESGDGEVTVTLGGQEVSRTEVTGSYREFRPAGLTVEYNCPYVEGDMGWSLQDEAADRPVSHDYDVNFVLVQEPYSDEVVVELRKLADTAKRALRRYRAADGQPDPAVGQALWSTLKRSAELSATIGPSNCPALADEFREAGAKVFLRVLEELIDTLGPDSEFDEELFGATNQLWNATLRLVASGLAETARGQQALDRVREYVEELRQSDNPESRRLADSWAQQFAWANPGADQ